MGRPERPVDPEAGPVQLLAHELRELRRAAGSPSYRTMAKSAGFSVTTLSQAASGQRLPSLAVVQGYVRACGGDPGEWASRWKEAEEQAARQVRAGEDDAAPPYRGLACFEPDDHALFFGRDRMVDELWRLVGMHRFAVLIGASGSGKSSLVRAGLIPRLEKEIAGLGRPAALRVLTPGVEPATTYGHLLAPTAGQPESWVVVDQFEETFTLCRDGAERARFIDLLLAARDRDARLRVLIVVRADFYARCAEYRELADALCRAGLLIGPMTADELKEVVVKPAQAAGLLVERELTARIVKEVIDQPGGLPMLSHALLETWRRRRGRLLTVAAYEAAGGVRGAIAASAEEVYGQMSAAQADAARQLLLRLVEPGRGTADTRRPLTRAELDEWANPSVSSVLELLARARLLTLDDDGVQLAHEALISCWPRLHGWIEQERERLLHHRRLTEAAHVWMEHDRDPGALYRGSRLARAEEIFPDHARDSALTEAERAFLAAACAAREAERRAAARIARRSRLLVTACSGVLVVALIAGLAAWQQQRDNQRQRRDNTARRVAAVADALRTTDPRTAMRLGVTAWRLAELPETRRALLASLAQPEQDTFIDPVPGPGRWRFLADSGRTLFSVDGRTWRTWNVATHRPIASGRLPAGRVLVASPDARVLALDGDDGVRLWDTSAGQWTGGPGRLPRDWYELGFGASGRSHLVSSADHGVQLLSVEDGKLLFEDREVADRVVATPNADDRLVALCPSGRSPQVWDIGRHRTVPGDWEHARDVCGEHTTVTFGEAKGGDRDRFAVVSETGVHVWDIRSGHKVAGIEDRDVEHTALSSDGAFLATVGRGELRVWRLAAPATPVFRHALNNQRLYDGLAWDPSGHVLRYLEGGTVHSLDLAAAVTPAWRDRPLDGVLLSPDGHTLATAERIGSHYRFQLRDTRDGRLARTLPSPPFPITRDRALPVLPQDTLPLMAFSPDGASLAYGTSALGDNAASQRFTVWDVTRDRKRTTLDLATTPSAAEVASLALGPGGRTLYASRVPTLGDPTGEVWDTARHRRTTAFREWASTHLALRPDGRLLVGDNRAAALPTGPVAGQSLVQGEEIAALAFSLDGSRLAAGDQSGRVALWDGSVRHRLGVLRNVFPPPLGDTPEGVSALALSPDGRTLAVGGDAGTLQLWDIATQQPLGGPLTTPGENITSLAFSPDSGTLYASSRHVPRQRYTIEPSRALAMVCARAGADLTRDQWRTYIPEVSYRRGCGATRPH
ncbi:hypothetical protein ABZ016_23525 [Streptomyces sp. NPDC006372]|uniref:nSTAND1 domain-containing NTPase n=1 Tax=Streptomyces sp. NPDC006372 TaxID=3155599 RepID=UPI0033A76BB4